MLINTSTLRYRRHKTSATPPNPITTSAQPKRISNLSTDIPREVLAPRYASGIDPAPNTATTLQSIWPNQACTAVPGSAIAAETKREQAKAEWTGIRSTRIYRGASRTPPEFASNPDTNPTVPAISPMRSAGPPCASGTVALKEDRWNRKETPRATIATSLVRSRARPPTNWLSHAPSTVNGSPIPILQASTRRL